MFSKAPERRMVSVRLFLFAAWIVLIISLFWDPISVALTQPDSGTPFAISDKQVQVQGQVLEQKPYAMGSRIFWTMILPCVPLFLMVFGHEAWRRICPLSFASRIPYYLGLQWLRKTFNRQTGRVERKPMTISQESFLARWHLPLQFVFLSSGVTARLLFINSDREAFAFFFIGIITAAMMTGLFFGGKTWCNYLCPIAPMQRIYTMPRGILETPAHAPKLPVTQSMCRTSGKDGDQSVCVSCISACPDVDLERSYWDIFMKPGSRFTYYGYFGMVLMFYGYYFLYSGGWDYYFSGSWTHEENAQANQLFNPGFWFNDQPIPLAKIIAAPLAMALAITCAYGMWITIEAIYARIARRLNPQITAETIRHRMFMVCAWTTFNTFYLFAGRPNIALMPSWLQISINTLIVSASTIWLMRNIGRSQEDHTEETLAAALRSRLSQSYALVKDLVRGKRLEDLSAAEINILSKVSKGDM
jgi:hypothetical protein